MEKKLHEKKNVKLVKRNRKHIHTCKMLTFGHLLTNHFKCFHGRWIWAFFSLAATQQSVSTEKKGIKTGFFFSCSADFIEQFVFISVCLIVNYVFISISHNGINNDVCWKIVEFKYMHIGRSFRIGMLCQKIKLIYFYLYGDRVRLLLIKHMLSLLQLFFFMTLQSVNSHQSSWKERTNRKPNRKQWSQQIILLFISLFPLGTVSISKCEEKRRGKNTNESIKYNKPH